MAKLCVCVCVNLTLLLAFLFTTPASAKLPTDPPTPKISEVAKSRIQATFLKAPLHFEPNQGQTDEQVKFLARGSGYQMFLTATEAVMVLREATGSRQPAIGKALGSRQQAIEKAESGLDTRHSELQSVLRMKLVGANPDAEVKGMEHLPGKVNYFIGNDPKKWRTNIPTYKRVEYRDVYPGINLVFYGNQRQLEYDFVVSPGADPRAIKLAFEGADKIEMDGSDVVITTASGSLRMRKPLVYQELAGVKKEIAGEYVVLSPRSSSLSTHSVGFQVAAYDRNKPLIIDPMLVYSTYLGGSGTDRAVNIAVDSSGNAYVTGMASSSNFPTTAGVYQPFYRGDTDIFVTKLNNDGSGLVYSTYIGGGRNEIGSGIAVDSAGNAYVAGSTASGDFPTVNAFQNTFGGVGNDVVFLKLNAQGSTLLYSTYLGGNKGAEGANVALDSSANAYVLGRTGSTNFPTTPGAFQATFGGWADVFVTKIDPTQVGGASLIYSTYLGGSGIEVADSIAVDSFGNAYVTGLTTSTNFPTTLNGFQTVFSGGEHDAFVTKINSGGSALLYSTYVGGSGSETQEGRGIAVDPSGNIYVAGCTSSPNFPTKNALQPIYGGGTHDAYVVKINPSQAGIDSLVYSTFLGGSGDECGYIALDTIGNAHLTGGTNSTDFPTTPGAFQASYGGGPYDTFVAKLSSSGSTLLYSTYLGGSNEDAAFGIAVDIAGNTYVAGHTNSTNLPVTPGAYQTSFAGGEYDAFVAKISFNEPPTASAGGPYTVAEGSTLVTLNGSGSDPDGDPLTYSWDLDDNGIFETASQNPTFSAVERDGPSSQKVVLQVCDNHGACATSTASVNITNVVPTVGGISAPVAPVQVNTLIITSASFTDPGVLDTHTAVWSWGDGTTSAGTVTETNGSGSVSGSHTYTAAGVYTVTLTVTDDDGGSGQSVFQFVVVFDPNAGFVTGGGWIDSPAGAYAANPSLTGKANFGFVSRYRPGATVPEGQTEFRFSVANLNFHSSNYEWLVVGGARAQYKGTGTINGAGSYNFILTAIDGQVSGGGGVDKFRIKIWGSGVIYDNQTGASDTTDPTTQLGGGSIVIHTQ